MKNVYKTHGGSNLIKIVLSNITYAQHSNFHSGTMKSFAIIFVLSCLALVSAVEEKKWGLTYGRILGKETVSAPAIASEYQIRAFAYPTVSVHLLLIFRKNEKYIIDCFFSLNLKQVPLKKDPIIGIKHINHSDRPVSVEFVHGGLNRKDVAVLIKSQKGHGINSEFIFYGM